MNEIYKIISLLYNMSPSEFVSSAVVCLNVVIFLTGKSYDSQGNFYSIENTMNSVVEPLA